MMTAVETIEDKIPCPYCREPIIAGALKCRHCQSDLSGGTSNAGAADRTAGAGSDQQGELAPRSIPEAVRRCLRKYFDFDGRATRLEFWSLQLFIIVFGMTVSFFAASNGLQQFAGSLSLLINLALLLPWLGAAVRRLHDTDRSGAWILLLLTIIGFIPVTYWLVKKGEVGPNRFGPAPHIAA
jgi:uncharacterized membrane protein YhaH (DUF805 family)